MKAFRSEDKVHKAGVAESPSASESISQREALSAFRRRCGTLSEHEAECLLANYQAAGAVDFRRGLDGGWYAVLKDARKPS